MKRLKGSRFHDPRFVENELGIVNWGGDLLPDTLLDAYVHGIYPLYAPDEPIFWYSPDPRCVLFLDKFHISKRSKRKIASQNFTLTINHAFHQVIRGCAEPRKCGSDTWIGKDIIKGYTRLYEMGILISVECWLNSSLAGGLYGLILGPFFCGESMFHRVPEASRAAFCGLVSFLRSKNFILIDCQQESPHMLAMGAELIDRNHFLDMLENFRTSSNYEAGLQSWLDKQYPAPFPVSFSLDQQKNIWLED